MPTDDFPEVPQALLLDKSFLPIRQFGHAINSSSATIRRLLDAGRLHAVRDGGVVKVRETPRAYLASLEAYVPNSGLMRPGPGRPRKLTPRGVEQVEPA